MRAKLYLHILIAFYILNNVNSDEFYDEVENKSIETEVDDKNIDNANNSYQMLPHPHGFPIMIMGFTPDFNITVDKGNLRKLFLHPEVQNRKAVTVSIIGAFRKGKSFIMDYFLRFMYAKYKSINNMHHQPVKGSWMGKPSDPLTGFSWKTSAERHTSGIVFWSDVFLYEDQNGEKYAIYLIDTQGLFDTKTPMQENIKIFGLGTLISSMQIFNLNDVIQEDQLQYLQMATDYARFAVAENKAKGIKGIKAFQDLLFLLRDWKNVDEYEYGLDEGRRYLIDVLQLDDNQQPDLQEVRRYIQASFEKVHCFLMPHPGFKVINNKKYDGRYSEMDVDFRNQLSSLASWLFSPKNLKAKKVFNEELTARKLYGYMQSYFEIFQSEAPEIESIYAATVSSHLKALVDASLAEFQVEISKNVSISSSDSVQKLENNFKEVKAAVLEKFSDERKMGNADQEEEFYRILETKIEEFYKDFKKHVTLSHEAYLETVAKAEQEKANFEEQLNEILQANRTQMAAEIERLEEDRKNKEFEILRKREELEATKNGLMQKILNDHTMTMEEINTSKTAVQQAYELKLKEYEIEEQNKAANYQQQLIELKNELALREQAIIERDRRFEESLKRHEEAQQQQLEKEQAFKMEQLKFEQLIEDQRFEREKQMYQIEMELEKQKNLFGQEMEAAKNANREKMMEVQLKIEEIKEKSKLDRNALEMEQMKQQKEMQMQILNYRTENERIRQQAIMAKDAKEQGMFGQILQAAVSFVPAITAAAGKKEKGSQPVLEAGPNLNSAPTLDNPSPNVNFIPNSNTFISPLDPYKMNSQGQQFDSNMDEGGKKH